MNDQEALIVRLEDATGHLIAASWIRDILEALDADPEWLLIPGFRYHRKILDPSTRTRDPNVKPGRNPKRAKAPLLSRGSA